MAGRFTADDAFDVTKNCVACGVSNPVEAVECSVCHVAFATVTPPVANPAPVATPPNARSKNAVWIVSGALLLIILVLLLSRVRFATTPSQNLQQPASAEQPAAAQQITVALGQTFRAADKSGQLFEVTLNELPKSGNVVTFTVGYEPFQQTYLAVLTPPIK